MDQDEITQRAVKAASPLTGWHAYPVFCNESLVASLPTEQLRATFIREQSAKYPLSNYGSLPIRA